MSLLDHPWWVGAIGFVGGLGVGYWLWRWRMRRQAGTLARQQALLMETTRREAANVLQEARLKSREEALRLRAETEREFAGRQRKMAEAERSLMERETLINLQLKNLVEEETSLHAQQAEWQRKTERLAQQQNELSLMARERQATLEAAAGLTTAEARQLLLREAEQQAQHDANQMTRRILEDAKSRAEEKARRILSLAIQRFAGEHTFESTSASLALPDGELKGRIIGREGRNIRTFEAATGVTVLIDDTPNTVVLSGFDPVRREIARESMLRLIADGRIHPTRIEEVVLNVTRDIEDNILRKGEEAVARVGLPPLHPEITRMLGRLRFRHSFSQNVLEHSIEVAHLAGLLAAEVGVDVALSKRAGLLHDIGKAVTQEIEGAHALVGADFVRRFGEPTEVVNAIAAHHNDVPKNGTISVLVEAADAISASRPGARSETMTTYLKRLEALESIGQSFDGVEKCYAVQAGRELRVLVQPDAVTDAEAFTLARNISRKIEAQLQYPGQIRVTVVRETRCVEFAK
ncbi:MAG: ribonuclease Y [Verrucomicrobia bacterium]|nr:ribonuclease Y [Verrucomicrobiota bacterium]